VIQVLLKAYPEACRVKDEKGNLPLHLAYTKQLALVLHEKQMLQNRKQAELQKAKWHLESVDANKFKFQIKEVDEFADLKIEIHKAAVEAVAANKKVMTTLLDATFETEKPVLPPPVAKVAKGVIPHVKEDKPLAEWLEIFQSGQGVDLKKANEFAATMDKHGQLAIHRALIKHAPVGAVEAILGGYPETPENAKKKIPRTPAGVEVADGAGMLPLHLAISARTSADVMLLVLRAYPDAAQKKEPFEDRMPLHFACDTVASDAVVSELLKVNFLAAREITTYGYLAMHYAAERDTSKFVMDALLMANPDAVKAKTNGGCLPLHRACKMRAPELVVNALLKFYPAAASVTDVRGGTPLHWAVGREQSLAVMTALVEAYPDALKTPDNDGNLPLHIALEYEAPEDVVKWILEKDVTACRVFNALKKLPYDIAVERNASEGLLVELERGVAQARNAEVGLLAWLWG